MARRLTKFVNKNNILSKHLWLQKKLINKVELVSVILFADDINVLYSHICLKTLIEIRKNWYKNVSEHYINQAHSFYTKK